MKQTKIFKLSDKNAEKEVNEFLKKNQDKASTISLNIFPEQIVAIYEEDQTKATMITHVVNQIAEIELTIAENEITLKHNEKVRKQPFHDAKEAQKVIDTISILKDNIEASKEKQGYYRELLKELTSSK